MKSYAEAYKKISATIKEYIARNKNNFWRTHSLFFTAGVTRAGELLVELEKLNNNPFATVHDLIAMVGQDKYNTGNELILGLLNDVHHIADTRPATVSQISRDIAQELNQMPLLTTKHRFPVQRREYRSEDPDVQALALRREYKNLVEYSRGVSNTLSEYHRILDAGL